jgi:hypothetical protein
VPQIVPVQGCVPAVGGILALGAVQCAIEEGDSRSIMELDERRWDGMRMKVSGWEQHVVWSMVNG